MLFLLWALPGTAVHAAIRVQDDSGQWVALDRPATRVISLAPHLTELVYSLDAGKQLVGVVEYSDYPPAAGKLPRIGNHAGIDLERVLALAPNLVLAWGSGSPAHAVGRFRRLRIPVFVSEIKELDGVAFTLERLGRLLGHPRRGAQRARAYRSRLRQLQDRYRRDDRLRVFVQVSRRPIITLAKTHWMTQILSLCGGENVFDLSVPMAPQVDTESVIDANPDVILVSDALADVQAAKEEWRSLSVLTAARRKQIYAFPASLLLRPTMRLLDGADWLCPVLEKAGADQ